MVSLTVLICWFVKENGLRQLEFQDFVRYFKAGCDSPKGIQEIGIPEMLAGQVDRDRYQRQPFLPPAVYGGTYLCEYIEVQPAYFPIVLEQRNEIRRKDDSFWGWFQRTNASAPSSRLLLRPFGICGKSGNAVFKESSKSAFNSCSIFRL